jgi:hypothetical protein
MKKFKSESRQEFPIGVLKKWVSAKASKIKALEVIFFA